MGEARAEARCGTSTASILTWDVEGLARCIKLPERTTLLLRRMPRAQGAGAGSICPVREVIQTMTGGGVAAGRGAKKATVGSVDVGPMTRKTSADDVGEGAGRKARTATKLSANRGRQPPSLSSACFLRGRSSANA